MADLEKTVAIIFEGVDQMGAGVNSATRQIDRMADRVEKAAAPLATVTKGLLAAEAAALGVAIAFGTRAYDAAVKFEAAQADLAKTLGDNDGSVDQFTRQITDLSNAYGESSTELLQSMANYKQAGFTAEESLALVKNGLDLVIAGDVGAAEASEYLVSTLKGFKAPASDAGELLEVLNASSNSYATSVAELAQGMARLSPIASSMGLGFDETAELLIPVIEVFRSGDEAANALRTGLLQLGNDTSSVTDALDSIKVAQRDSNGVLRDSSDILIDVAIATADMAESERLFVAQQLFGIEQSAKMVEVLKALEAGSVDVNQAMANSASVAEEVATRLGTAEKAADRSRESFENLARTLGLEFLAEIKGINEALAEVFVQFEGAAAEGAMDEFWAAITPTLREIERLALEVAEALPTALAEADYSGFAEGMQALFGDLEDVEISADDVRAAIEGLGDTFRSLSEFTSGTFEVFKGFVAVLKPIVEAFTSLDGETQKWLGVVGGVSLVIGPATGAVKGLTTAVQALAGARGAIPLATAAIPKLGTALAVLAPAAAPAAAVAGILLVIDKLDELTTSAEKDAANQAAIFARMSEPLQEVIRSFDDLTDAQELGYVKWDHASGQFIAANDAAIDSMRELFGASENMISDAAIQSARQVAGAVEEVGNAADPAAESLAKIEQAAIDAALVVAGFGDGAEAVGELDDAAQQTGETVIGLNGEVIEVSKTITTMGDATKAAGDEAKKGAEKFSELEKTAMELASNEKIAAMEFTASINVAAIEADAQKVEAILSATSSTIEATAGSIDGLFNTLAGGDLSFRQQWDLEDAVEQQMQIQRQAADQQGRLIDANIRAMEAKAEALRSGEGLIRIDSTGLEPALETVMWQIIEKVQLRANAEGAEFLLGL